MSTKPDIKSSKSFRLFNFCRKIPGFIATLVSAIYSNTMLPFVDRWDSFGNLLHTVMITILSKKTSKDLRYEHWQGIKTAMRSFIQ